MNKKNAFIVVVQLPKKMVFEMVNKNISALLVAHNF